jgi:hypothetical protein
MDEKKTPSDAVDMLVEALAPKVVAKAERRPGLRSRSVVGRQAESEAWRLVGEGKLLVHEVPKFVEAREREARALKTAALSVVPNMNRQQRRALAAQARKAGS